MEIQVEELTHVLEILPKTRSPSLSLSPLSPSFNAKQDGCRIEPVQDTFVHLGWLAQKARSTNTPLPGSATAHWAPGGEVLTCGQAWRLPAARPRRAESEAFSRDPSDLSSSVSGDTPGYAKLISLDSFKTALYGCFKFYLIKEQMLYKRRSVGD